MKLTSVLDSHVVIATTDYLSLFSPPFVTIMGGLQILTIRYYLIAPSKDFLIRACCASDEGGMGGRGRPAGLP